MLGITTLVWWVGRGERELLYIWKWGNLAFSDGMDLGWQNMGVEHWVGWQSYRDWEKCALGFPECHDRRNERTKAQRD